MRSIGSSLSAQPFTSCASRMFKKACCQGMPQNDVGMRTDVLDCCPKAEGLLFLLRSMAPAVIAVDEIGGEEDLHALRYASSCGCKLLTTVHGADIEEIRKKPVILLSRFSPFTGVTSAIPGTARPRPLPNAFTRNCYGDRSCHAGMLRLRTGCRLSELSGQLLPSAVKNPANAAFSVLLFQNNIPLEHLLRMTLE